MKKLPLFVTVAGLTVGCSAPAPNIYTSYSPYGSEGLRVSGTAVVRAEPDFALVELGLTNTGSTAKVARAENADVIRKVTQAIRTNGVAAEDLRTAKYTMSAVDIDPNPNRQKYAWRVVNVLEVRVRDVAKVASVIDAATEAGANQVGGIRFALEDLHQIRTQARAKAAEIAGEKARQLAAALGAKLGRVVSITDSANRGWWSGSNVAQANVNNEFAVSPSTSVAGFDSEVSSGQLSVEAVIEVVYELH